MHNPENELSDLKTSIDVSNEVGAVDAASSSNYSVPTATAPVDTEGERRVRQTINNAAAENTALLDELMTTEEAVAALQNNESRLRVTKKEILSQNAAVQKASLASAAQFRKYTQDRESLVRKWYYILTKMRANFDTKVKEAEHLYYTALKVQSDAEKRQRELKHDVDAIEEENVSLSKQAQKHMNAHIKIDNLYDSIFEGPTPGFSDEDEREEIHKSRKAEHDAATENLRLISKASKDVRVLKTAIERAEAENRQASYEVGLSIFSFDRGLTYLDRCGRLIDQATDLRQTSLEALSNTRSTAFHDAHRALADSLSSARNSADSAVNAYHSTPDELYDIIRRTDINLRLSKDAQNVLAKVMKKEELVALKAVGTSSRALENARQALQEIRQSAFELTVGFGASAPAYHECCDRADGYSAEAISSCERVPDPIIDDSGLPPPPSYQQATE